MATPNPLDLDALKLLIRLSERTTSNNLLYWGSDRFARVLPSRRPWDIEPEYLLKFLPMKTHNAIS
ncbi:hypothetical protein FA13DRAFT_1730966 [Coprinellus micaceus]|uniref:Uncharacterized protein n=1 Tax=Coprinellus micaceus TaxID=71717 RepID=A0A4Y7TGV0_COPMI|nr:hypothetical protein FA13DRAFT_1730966 [Coprinellus micaceus]